MNIQMSCYNMPFGSLRLLRHNTLGITATVARFWNRFSVHFGDKIFTCLIDLSLNHECLNELQCNILFGSVRLLWHNTLVQFKTIGIIVTV